MYRDYWHLTENPFENVFDFRYLYAHPYYEESLARLYYAVSERKGGAVLTGGYGTGKSTVRESLIKKLKQDGKFRVFSIVHAKFNLDQIIQDCFFQMGITDMPKEKPLLLHTFGNKLLELNEKGEHAVLVIDDAHLIDTSTLEELKLLINLHDYNERSLFTLILVGEPMLRSKLVNIPSLLQRLRIMSNLMPLDRNQTADYIAYRLKVAGGAEDTFLPEAVDEIYGYSRGVLREINNLCDIALLVCFNEKIPRVGADVIKRIINDLTAQTEENLS
jgi:type II secretory pathway predicted ATPase ExeA